jgi:hypothetical protein
MATKPEPTPKINGAAGIFGVLMMETVFSVHRITDYDGSENVASLEYNPEDRSAAVRIGSYKSGTAMRGEADRLIRTFAKKAVSARLFLPGNQVIRLPLKGRAV